jgi:hypothetical protein
LIEARVLIEARARRFRVDVLVVGDDISPVVSPPLTTPPNEAMLTKPEEAAEPPPQVVGRQPRGRLLANFGMRY